MENSRQYARTCYCCEIIVQHYSTLHGVWIYSLSVRLWLNESIFHSIFYSTFELLIYPKRNSASNMYHHKHPPIETLLRKLSLDSLGKVTKPLDFPLDFSLSRK